MFKLKPRSTTVYYFTCDRCGAPVYDENGKIALAKENGKAFLEERATKLGWIKLADFTGRYIGTACKNCLNKMSRH